MNRKNDTKFDNKTMKNITSPYLYIEKSASSQGSYDDGIFIRFGEKKPQHITLEIYTEDADIETCDLRLTTVENATKPNSTNTSTSTNVTKPVVSLPAKENFTKVAWQDVAFFRFGYFNYQKMNLVSMVNKFKNGTWYKVDLLIDWNSQAVTVYVDNNQLASDKFFTNAKTTIKSVNSLVLYNLTPGGRCRVRSLMVCPERCDSKLPINNGPPVDQYSYTYAMGDLLRSLNLLFVTLLVLFVYLL